MPGEFGTSVPSARFRADVIAHEVGTAKDVPHLSRELIVKYLADLSSLGLI